MQIMIKERCGVALPNSPPLKKIFERLLESYPNTMGSSYPSLSLSLEKKRTTPPLGWWYKACIIVFGPRRRRTLLLQTYVPPLLGVKSAFLSTKYGPFEYD